jgi:cysteine sulfinate desulfinase/cysteine desulfurase-like protein
MAKNISLILHRFKDVRTSILTLIFEDSPIFNSTGAQMYLGSRELSDLLEKLGKTHEEAAEILEKVILTPSHYRLQMSLNDEQEEHARRTFTEPW